MTPAKEIACLARLSPDYPWKPIAPEMATACMLAGYEVERVEDQK